MVKAETKAPARWRKPPESACPPPSTGAPLLGSTGKLRMISMSSPSARVRTLSESLISLDRIVWSGRIGLSARMRHDQHLASGLRLRRVPPVPSDHRAQPLIRHEAAFPETGCAHPVALRPSTSRAPHCCLWRLLVLTEPGLRCWSIQHPLRTRPRHHRQSHSPLGPDRPPSTARLEQVVDKWLTGNLRRAYDATDIDPALRQLRRWQHVGTDRILRVIRLRLVFGRQIAC